MTYKPTRQYGTTFRDTDYAAFHKFLPGTPCTDCLDRNVDVFLLGGGPRCVKCFRDSVKDRPTRGFSKPASFAGTVRRK